MERRTLLRVLAVRTFKLKVVSNSSDSQRIPDNLKLKENESLPKRHNVWRTFHGLLYAFFVALITSLLSVIVKKLENVDPRELSMFRMAGMFLGSLPIVIFEEKKHVEYKRKLNLLLVRGLFETLGIHMTFQAFRMLPLAEVSIILSTIPAVTMVFARVLLGEPCGLIPGIAFVISFCGVMLAIRLPMIIVEGGLSASADINHLLGITVTFGCVLCRCCSVVAMRKMKDVHYGVVMFATGLVGTLGSAGIIASFSSFSLPRCGIHRMWNVLVAIMGFLGQYSLILALQVESSGIFTVMCTSFSIFLAMTLQVIFFQKYLDIFDISGGILAAISVGIIALSKGWKQRSQECPDLR